MDDLISRQAAIDAIRKGYPDAINSDYKDGLRIGTDRAIYHVEQLPSAQPDITHIIFETLAECGIYGEEATIKLIGTLKRLGRNDLLPPCVR